MAQMRPLFFGKPRAEGSHAPGLAQRPEHCGPSSLPVHPGLRLSPRMPACGAAGGWATLPPLSDQVALPLPAQLLSIPAENQSKRIVVNVVNYALRV